MSLSASDDHMVTLNVTDPNGVLFGQVKLTADDLQHPDYVGRQVIETLPRALAGALQDVQRHHDHDHKDEWGDWGR